MKTLSLCMIVKDGEKYIERCLESVADIVKEVIIVDTGSQDNTLELAKRFEPQVYQYEWKDDFADARNASLQYATGDYILVLDADEVVFPEDSQKLIQAVNNTEADGLYVKFHNFTVENSEETFNMHLGLRVLKNGFFKYSGKIHEQPVFLYEDKKPICKISDVRVKHYGYLPSNSGEKKRGRNMAIIEKLLDENPDDNFNLFNMGNEYMCMNDFESALKYFDKADANRNIYAAYTPYLMFRRAVCLYNLSRYGESLGVIGEGLKYYPRCTDLEFLRGTVLKKLKRFSLSLESFDKCIEMGESPPAVSFFAEVADFKPLMEKAEIYFIMDDYSKALDCCLKALSINRTKYYLIYEICKILNNIYKNSNKDEIYKHICNLFADCGYKPNVMITTDALLNERLFSQADTAFSKFKSDSCGEVDIDIDEVDIDIDSDIYFLKGRILFYKKEYEKAFERFSECVKPQMSDGTLYNIKNRSYEYMLACSLLCGGLSVKFIEIADSLEDLAAKSVYLAFHKNHSGSIDAIDEIDESELDRIKSILSKMLYVGEYDAFERSLNILNFVDSKRVLLALAELYYEAGFFDMSVKTVLRSVKELDTVDSTAAFILNKVL